MTEVTMGDASAINGVKKELSINDFNSTFDEDNNSAVLNESIFDTIPLMANLLKNLKCSFCSEGNEIVIANVELNTLSELFDRLRHFYINANRMECHEDGTFSMAFATTQIIDRKSNRENSTSMRLLPWVTVALCSQGINLHLTPDSIEVSLVSISVLSKLMQRLRLVNMKPARIRSFKESVYTIVFNLDSLPSVRNTTSKSIKSKNNTIGRKDYDEKDEPYVPPKQLVIRPRACPNYLKDYVVDKDEPMSPKDEVLPMESLSVLLPKLPDDKVFSNLSPEYYGDICKKVRGRPRIRPLKPVDLPKRRPGRPSLNNSSPKSTDGTFSPFDKDNLDGNIPKKGRGRPRINPIPTDVFPKRPRGRPSRSECVPYPMPANNSFLNIQPRNFFSEQFKNCYEKFLQTDLEKTDLQ